MTDVNLMITMLLGGLWHGASWQFLVWGGLNGLGLMTQNFVRMNFWTDPFSDSGFVESWTVFYWAWWVAFAPYVGLFITRISRGRTIRQVIKGMLIYGSLGCWVFYMIIGNYSMYLQMNDIVDVLGTIKSSGGSAAIVATLEAMPMAPVVITVFTLMSIIFAGNHLRLGFLYVGLKRDAAFVGRRRSRPLASRFLGLCARSYADHIAVRRRAQDDPGHVANYVRAHSGGRRIHVLFAR